ncbi:hypothetical protein DCCM_4474 [Desulfocucumis palustris]|uniref:Uncharacterized protein n=1 Tax=Desulfocucumis palustris TaxID=1898651 RepID=A0A2L2XN26_9FIRM|nr:hypothetical protein [Desulfocucumis palustris]GBF35351.1 hypothetical protein DCCM_4474 [Desulfocucumis palustris]
MNFRGIRLKGKLLFAVPLCLLLGCPGAAAGRTNQAAKTDEASGWSKRNRE